MKEQGSIMVSKAQIIGSRPPKCEGRCRTCGHCEAVQVPVVPLVQSHKSHYYSKARATTTITYSSRGDNLSNYKPLSWKCKCGDYYFNPWMKLKKEQREQPMYLFGEKCVWLQLIIYFSLSPMFILPHTFVYGRDLASIWYIYLASFCFTDLVVYQKWIASCYLFTFLCSLFHFVVYYI